MHAFYNRSTPFLLSLLAAICKINLLKFYDLKLKGKCIVYALSVIV